MHARLATTLDEALDRIDVDPAGSTRQWADGAGPLADADPPYSEGMDGPTRGGRKASGGNLALASGAARRRAREHRASPQLEEWMRSYRPEELFDDEGRLMPELAALAPRATRG